MLSTLLDRLTGYFSKYFLIGSFFPIFFFAVINGILAHMHLAVVRAWVGDYLALPAARQAYDGFTGLILVAVAAYLVSTLKNYLRELLEGEHWPNLRPVNWLLKDPLVQKQNDRLTRLGNELRRVQEGRRPVRKGAPVWREKLAQARGVGERTGVAPTYDTTKSTTILGKLRSDTLLGIAVPSSDLSQSVEALTKALESGDLRQDTADADRLDRDQQELLEIIDYAANRWDTDYVAAFNRRQAYFGDTVVAPTAFGNIAATIRNYAGTRYRMNVEAFWTRLQPILQRNQSFFADLQETKTQLDFLVTMFWLTAATAFAWLVLIVVTHHGIPLFVGIGLGGPLLAWVWYALGITNYVAFAQMVRSGIDLNRFDLLRSLHVGLPGDLQQERLLWDALNQLAQYGESPPLHYHHGEGS